MSVHICQCCGHTDPEHEDEPPYPCYICDCKEWMWVKPTEDKNLKLGDQHDKAQDI